MSEEKLEKKLDGNFLRDIAICFVGGIAGISWSIWALKHSYENKNPEYFNFLEAEVSVEDRNGDGKEETYMKYKGRDFIIKESNGRPEFLEYPAR